jgi:Spy/CpxP family protein refolding chaperone
MAETWAGSERTRGLFLLGVVFLLGMVCGAALFYLGQRSMMPPRLAGQWRDGPHPGAGLERLSRELDLDPDQRRKIEEILAERRSRMQKFVADGRSEIRDILRPEQQKIFDAMPHDRPGRHGWRPGPAPDDQLPGPPPGPPPDGEPGPGPEPPAPERP